MKVMSPLVLEAILLASVASGCIGGGSPGNVMLRIANESGDAATVAWARPGLLGNWLIPSTGTDSVEACNAYLNGFGVGHNEVTITTSHDTLNLVFNASSRDQDRRYVVIDPNGAISEVDEPSMPVTGCGTIS